MPGERGSRIHLRHSGRGKYRHHGCAARQQHQVRHHASRAGRGVHGRRVRAADGQGGRVHVDAGSGCDQPDHGGRRRQHGPRPDRRHCGPGRDNAFAQGKPPDTRPGQPFYADHQVQHADSRSGDRAGNRAQGVQGRTDRKAGRRLHRFSREHRRIEVRR